MTDAADSVWRRLYHTRFRDMARGRIDASLDWRGYVALSGLPPELTAAVVQVVRRTRLWRKEKADIAAELVAHFQDGLAAGRTSDELLQSFGDAQLSARLIRRAKKRGRPMTWHAWRYALISAITIIVLYVVAGFWMATARPKLETDYFKIVTKQATAAPESDRAWPLYRDALLAMGRQEAKSPSHWSRIDSFDAAPGDAAWKDAEKFLNANAPAVSKLREASQKPALGFVASMSHADFSKKDNELFGVSLTPAQIEEAKKQPAEDRWVISTLVPDLQYLRDVASVLAADAQRSAQSGDANTALADITAILGVSRHSEEMPFLICTLVADGVQKKAYHVVQSILTHHPKLWSNDQLRELAHKLAASQIDWRRGFEGERSCFYDTMQRVYTDDGHGDGRLALRVSSDKNLFQLIESVASDKPASSSIFAKSGIALLALPAANWVVAGRREMTEMYNSVTDRSLARLGTPFWKWAKEPSLDDEVQSLNHGPVSRFRYLFVVMLTPSHDTLLTRVVASNGDRDGVLIGLALELYHHEHGKWPASLADLSPRFLPTLPPDPITGGPLHYKVVNDRPLVYSVGIDGKDDGGRLPKNERGELQPDYAKPYCGAPTAKQLKPSDTDGDWVLWSKAEVTSQK
jgi:hypothetical protein